MSTSDETRDPLGEGRYSTSRYAVTADALRDLQQVALDLVQEASAEEALLISPDRVVFMALRAHRLARAAYAALPAEAKLGQERAR